MLRTELSAALARLAAADSPPTASRPCSAPQQADSSAAAQHAACLPQPGAPHGSQKQENSDIAQPAAQATVSLSQTNCYSTREKPEGRVHQTSLSHGPCLKRAGLGDASCRIRMTQRGSVNHAQQPQRALAEAAKEERAGCLEAPLPAQALGSNPIVVLATLAALQQHFRQQLASTNAARSADSAIYPHQLPNEEGGAAASVAKTGAASMKVAANVPRDSLFAIDALVSVIPCVFKRSASSSYVTLARLSSALRKRAARSSHVVIVMRSRPW